MQLTRKTLIITALASVVTIGVAFTRPAAPPEQHFKNLKIFPKNINPDKLDKIMDSFADGLGIKCDFCHAGAKDSSDHLDFASDAKPEKEVARKMMRMTVKINRKFFEAKKPIMVGDYGLPVSCITCHHGSPHPEDAPNAGGKEEKH